MSNECTSINDLPCDVVNMIGSNLNKKEAEALACCSKEMSSKVDFNFTTDTGRYKELLDSLFEIAECDKFDFIQYSNDGKTREDLISKFEANFEKEIKQSQTLSNLIRNSLPEIPINQGYCKCLFDCLSTEKDIQDMIAKKESNSIDLAVSEIRSLLSYTSLMAQTRENPAIASRLFDDHYDFVKRLIKHPIAEHFPNLVASYKTFLQDIVLVDPNEFDDENKVVNMYYIAKKTNELFTDDGTTDTESPMGFLIPYLADFFTDYINLLGYNLCMEILESRNPRKVWARLTSLELVM